MHVIERRHKAASVILLRCLMNLLEGENAK